MGPTILAGDAQTDRESEDRLSRFVEHARLPHAGALNDEENSSIETLWTIGDDFQPCEKNLVV